MLILRVNAPYQRRTETNQLTKVSHQSRRTPRFIVSKRSFLALHIASETGKPKRFAYLRRRAILIPGGTTVIPICGGFPHVSRRGHPFRVRLIYAASAQRAAQSSSAAQEILSKISHLVSGRHRYSRTCVPFESRID
jgi:hypothetical protein